MCIKLLIDFHKLKSDILNDFPAYEDILSDKDWECVKKKYKSRYTAICSTLKAEETISSEAFLDRYILGRNGDTKSKAIIDMVKDNVCKITSHVNNESSLYHNFKNMMRNMILSMDQDPKSSNSDYKNWIHEIVVFGDLCEKDITILRTEEVLSNGKSVDFHCVFNCSEKKCEILFDVITLQNIKPELQDNNDEMNKFIRERLQDKFDNKMHDVDVGIKKMFRVLPVVPFVPGLAKYHFNVDTNISLPIMTVCFNQVGSKLSWYFGQLNDVCKQYNNQQQ